MSNELLKHLFWLGLMMFILRLGSSAKKDTDSFRNNLVELSETNEEFVAHSDTMNYAIELINPEEVENVKVKMIKLLIFNKRLDTFRLFGEFRIAIDGPVYSRF